MTRLQENKGYIRRTKIRDAKRYALESRDIPVFRELANRDTYEAVFMAFEYGRAKGYRAAKKENKNENGFL